MKPSIFVVEDDPDISRLVRHHLENDGFAVRVYANGANVIADAERQRPALFVLDIMVPGKDGLELCRTVRQTPGLASVPVIFLTAKSSEADRVLGLEIGADDYIPKPFSPRELVARVKAVLRRFERPLRIRFGQCDPAGIVYFPQYLVMLNGLLEDWFTDGLGVSYAELLGPRRVGTPTVRLECDFKAISRPGDAVVLGLQVQHLGRSSLILDFDCRAGNERRLAARKVLVFTSLDTHKPIGIPDDVRQAITDRYLNELKEN